MPTRWGVSRRWKALMRSVSTVFAFGLRRFVGKRREEMRPSCAEWMQRSH